MLASTEAGKQKLFELWSKKVEVKSLPLSELDQISLSMRLAVLDPDNSEFILKAQAKLIKNKDRKARFNFLLPALSSNAAVRAEFVDSLRDYSNREREAWVIAGLSYVHHPSRAIESVAYISSGLNLLTEIQRTGDIFFPSQWLNAIFDGHNSSVALEIALDFLSENPSLPAGLLDKIEQAIDPLRRSVAISMSN
jgi:aminopeptidase N